MTVSDVRTAATRPVEPSARTRPDRGQESCSCCSGDGAHGDGSKCDRCEGSGSVPRNDPSPHCPGQGQPRRRHWRQAADSSHYVLYHGAHHDDVPSIMNRGLERRNDQPTVTTSRDGASLYGHMRDWTAPKVLEIHVPHAQAGRYLDEGHEGTGIEGTVHALKATLPPSFIHRVHEAARRPPGPHMAAWTPSSGIFAPTTGFDPTLFDARRRLRPEVRRDILERLDTALRVDGGVTGSEWQDELRVYIAGGSASEWAGGRPNDTAQDLDILIGVDYPAFRGNQPTGEHPPDDREIDARLNEALRKHFNKNGWYPGFGGAWDVTGYVNPAAWDIRTIKPYAAWDVTRDRWAVRPPHLPEHSMADFDPALVREARAVATWARAILALQEPARTHEARALWEHIHRDRSRAFSADGEGWQDPGNLIEKWISYAPGGLLNKIRELVYGQPKTAAIQPGNLPDGYAMEVNEEKETHWGHPALHLNVHHEGKQVAGLGVFQRPDEETGALLAHPNVWVNPEHQRKGLGTAMYAEVHRRWPGVPVLHSPHQSDDARALNLSLKQRFGPDLHHGSQGLAHTAVTGYGDLDDRTAMVCLEIPHHLVEKVPGGVDEDPHITVVYLGKISERRYWEICCEAAAVAERARPLHGVMHGTETFPPSDSNDGKTPAFVPAYLPGIGAIRRELEHLNASKHDDFRPHVTLAYLEKGDPVPPPHPARDLRFTNLTVKRGDRRMRFPLGGNSK